MKTPPLTALFLALTLVRAPAEDLQTYSRTLAEDLTTRGESVAKGLDGWLFFVPELRHLGAGAFWGARADSLRPDLPPEQRDPLPAILAFHQALKARGVDLLLVPVPPKAVILADQLPGFRGQHFPRQDVHHQAFYQLLREKGVEVLDLTDAFLADQPDASAPLYCRQDTHWSGNACVEAARLIASHIRDRLPDQKTHTYATAWRTIELTGDLWRMLQETDTPKEQIPIREVEAGGPVPDSPVLLLGDSHALVFHGGDDMHATNAGLADQLAVELGMPVDLVAVRGSGATPARINLFRRVRRQPDYWDGKRVVIWVFAAREFTESDGWRIVPIEP